MVLDLDLVLPETLKSFVTKEEIEALEAELLQIPGVRVEPVKHTVHDGIYVRELFMPKGTFAVGQEHKCGFINIVTKGSASVLIDGEVKVIGPSVFVSNAVDRKVGYVHEDITWITVHRTDLESIEEIEASIIVKSDTFKQWEQSKTLV